MDRHLLPRTTGSLPKGKTTVTSRYSFWVGVIFLTLFALLPQKARAGDSGRGIKDANPSSGYIAGWGYYIQFDIQYYDGTKQDEWIDWFDFYLLKDDGTKVKVFALDSWWDSKDENADFNMASYNGFKVQVCTNKYGWTNVSTTQTGMWAQANGEAESWCYVRIFLPQDYLDKSNLKWEFSGKWGCKDCGSGTDSFTGQRNTTNVLPTFSSITTPALQSNGYYSFDYSLNNNKVIGAAKVQVSSPTCGSPQIYEYSGASSVNQIVSYNTTSSTADDWLDSKEANHTVNLKATWAHSTTGIVYTVEKTGIEMKHIRYPKSIAVTNNNDGTLRINWTTDALPSSYSSDGWRLQYQINDSTGTWKDVPSPIPVVDNSVTAYEKLFTIPETERNQGEVKYYFRVSRKCTSESNNYQETSSNINTDYKQLTEIKIVNGKDNYPRLTWNLSSSGIYCSDDVSLKLKIGTVETDITDSLAIDSLGNGAFQTSINEGVIDCSPQRYQLILKNGTNAAITYTVNNNYVYTPLGNREFESVTVSKGYYPDKINIKWTLPDGYDEFNSFRIKRKQLDESDDKWVTIGGDISHIRNTLSYNYDDNGINAGIYYEYKIEGLYKCDEDAGSIPSPTSLGFSQPFGSVSGRITYAGSSAVAGVSISLTTNDALRSNRELEFLGGNKSYINVPAKEKLLSPNGFSFQAWLNNRGNGAQTLVDNGSVLVTLDASNHPAVTLAGRTLTADTAVVRTGEYNHLTITASKSGSAYDVRIYMNGKLVKNGVVAPSSVPANSSIIKVGSLYKGYMDDIRFWSKVLSADEIKLNYDRILSGKESGLIAYYKCDETDRINSDLFDCSAEGTQFHGYHAIKGIDATRRDVPIEASHLSLKGVTDADGIYSITNSVPYTSEGTTYTIAPIFGIHQFDPSQRPLYFSPDSKVFNNVDFTDVSSFPVSGKVMYRNSNYPVDSVQILIDGMPANKDGQAIMTDAQGKFTVDVPIGTHFITVSKQGHTFANGGRYPVNPLEKYNFQNSLDGLNFIDVTTVRLMGRVVGGGTETARPLGFGLSRANIGQATVTLRTANDYRFNLTDKDSTTTSLIGNKESETTFKQSVAGSLIEIKTNAETGEFVAVLPPVPYNLIGAKTKDFTDTGAEGDEYDFSYSRMTFDMNPLLEQKTTFGNQTFAYHDSVKITRYNDPVIQVIDQQAVKGAFGDSVYIYMDKTTGKEDPISLYEVDKTTGTITYTLGTPVLTQKKLAYHWWVKAYETYNNSDGTETATDTVPLAGATIDISNSLASMRIDVDTTTTALTTTLAGESNTQLTLDSVGCKAYSFNVGFPNINGNHQLAAKFTLDQNGKTYIWEKSAILFGQLPTDGSNFVTKGPDKVDIVLHDPPGSNSYAYIAKGSSYTTTTTRSDVNTVTATEELTAHIGPKLTTSSGFGFAIETETNVVADIETHAEEEHVYTDNWEVSRTTTFNEQISTSGDPNYIGSGADVYIGKSSNLTFGKMRQLALYPKAQDAGGSGIPVGDYRLFTQEVLTADQEFATGFSYTQTHVLETQIPNIKALRNQLLTTIVNASDTVNIFFGDAKARYFTDRSASDEDYGEPETYRVFYSPTAKENEKVDQVWAYNTWILNWKKRIEDNEKARVDLFAKRADYAGKKDAQVFENISYDAGASLEKSLEVNYEHVVIDEHSFNAEGSIGVKSGYVFTGVGFEGHLVAGARREQTNGDNSTDSNSMTFGYVLAEDESVLFAGKDALSVDVYGPSSDAMQRVNEGDSLRNLAGFTFQLRAGQTSCPYEAVDSTLFYRNGEGKPELLNYGTFKIEKANLYVDSKKLATAENIPAGREASFTLQLQNNSEANMDVTYLLAVDPASNRKGLVLELDGEPLVSGRQIRINYGEEITKVLKVRQSSLDILDYDSIAIRLGSVCDIYDYDEAYISAHFTPSSSPVTLRANSSQANRAALEGGGKITFTVSEYERTFKNFGMIRLQYRKSTDETWTTIKEYVNDETLYPLTGNREKIVDYTLTYDFSYDEVTPSDGEYVFRALAVSKVGSKEVTTPSGEIIVTKDVRAPQALGNPSPVNGILNTGDEISITFNEDIQTGLATDDKFSITGILNADIRREPTSGLTFDGASSLAYTELPLHVNGSFAIEGWIQMKQLKAGTLFAYGEGDRYFSLGFDAGGHAVVKIGKESSVSTDALAASEVWRYVSVSYDSGTSSVSVYALDGENNLKLMQSKSFVQTPPTQGKFYVGNNSESKDGFRGAVGLLHFYNTARTIDDASVSKYENKSGNEPTLIGLWELEEGEGTVAKDKARARNLVLNTAWYVYPAGRSLAFNGNDEYATISSETFRFRTFDDFTYEFRFKGGTQGEVTLLSADTSVYVGFNAAHELVLTVRGTTQKLAAAGLLNDQWHHFALSVKRGGNANAYVDGQKTATFGSSIFTGSVGGAYHYLGAEISPSGTPPKNTYSRYFKGNIDEVRIWASALASDAILLEKNHKLSGTEAGLKAYYPFETYEKRDQLIRVYESLDDMVTLLDPKATTLKIGHKMTTSEEAASMQDVRPVKEVSFTVTPSDRKIVLNITEDAYRIEGVTLTITAKDILDMHNNPSSAATWIAYVNQSPLKWQADPVSLTIEQGETKSFKAAIANRSGANTAYYIENVPAWLTADAVQGNLQPQQSKELTFRISENINIGSYEASVVLTGDNQVREILPVTLKVTGERPDWSVNPGDYEQSMTATGRLLIEGIMQEDEDDLLAAFINDTCVGVISPQYIPSYQSYYAFITIWGNPWHDGKEVTFKMWDASTGQVYPVVELTHDSQLLNIRFTGDDIVGSVENPVSFNAIDVVEQSISLGKGWNWISVNVESKNPSLISQFKEKMIDFANQVKANGGLYINKSGSSWGGTLDSIPVKEGYLVKTTREAILKLIGKAVQPAQTPIKLAANKWSWIGYTPRFALPVKDALAGITDPKQGDQVKGQKGYRIMSSNGWIGSLSYMEPGRGYMYKSGNNQEVAFHYPSTSILLKSAMVVKQGLDFRSHWETDYYRFANTMTVTASFLLNEEEIRDGFYEIAAFSGDDCRGSAIFEYIEGFEHPFMGFLMIYGEENDPITFRIYDHTTGTEYMVREHLKFQTDAIYGTPDKTYPVSASLNGPTDAETIGAAGIRLYPNPVETLLYISHSRNALDFISVTNVNGKLIWMEEDFTEKYLNVSSYIPGVYFLRIVDKGQTYIYKFIKK